MHRNRKVKPVEVWAPPPPHNRRLSGWELRLGVRRHEVPGIMSEWFYEVVFPGVTLLALFILALLTFFL
jgi:hypothetical protein